MRVATAALAILCALTGCSIAAGLGDPKQPPQDDTLQPIAIAVGGTHACAVVVDGPNDPLNGTVRCWGSNTHGELGVDPSSVTESAVPVSAGSTPLGGVLSLALTRGASCATTMEGFFHCWGAVPSELPNGVHREPGMGAFEPTLVDVGNARLDQVTAASLGPDGGAVLSANALIVWGNATYEQRDGGSSGFDGGVSVGQSFSGAAVGAAHACAITEDGTDVECWGDNSHGQAGVPPPDLSTVVYPTYMGLPSLNAGSVSAVAAGRDFSCALMSKGSVYCWGANDVGQLGNPTVARDTSTPTQVSLGMGIVALELARRDAHGCVATAGNSVHCWGDDSVGQLGVGVGGTSPTFRASPMVVERASAVPLKPVTHVAAAGNTTCATRVGDTHVWCWGANESGQAGQSPRMTVVAYAMPLSL
jgi:alpha-tubulin suppressor-like RCC1 family protein